MNLDLVGLGDRITDPSQRLVVASAAMVVLSIVALAPRLDSFTLYLLTIVSVLSIYAVSYDLLFGYTGLISLGHAVFFGIGAYGAVLALQTYDVGLFGGLGVAMVAALLVALVFGYAAVRIGEDGFVIITLISVLVTNLIAVNAGDLTGGTDGMSVTVPPLEVPGIGEFLFIDPLVRFYFVFGIAVLAMAFIWRLVHSPVGLVLKMIRDNEDRAQLIGYNVHRYKLGSFAISGMVSGLAGALFTYTTAFVSTGVFSISRTAEPLIFTLLGGRGTLIGPVAGAIGVTLTEEWLSGLTFAYSLFIGVLLVVMAIMEPEGIVGIVKRLLRNVRSSEKTKDHGEEQ